MEESKRKIDKRRIEKYPDAPNPQTNWHLLTTRAVFCYICFQIIQSSQWLSVEVVADQLGSCKTGFAMQELHSFGGDCISTVHCFTHLSFPFRTIRSLLEHSISGKIWYNLGNLCTYIFLRIFFKTDSATC